MAMHSAGAALGQTPTELIAGDADASPDALRAAVTVTITDRIEEVEAAWRQLEAGAIESPGQNYDFIRLWTRNRGLKPQAQCYVVGSVDGVPVALLPLHRKRVNGVWVLTWFPGSNVGCYAPVADYERLAALGVAGRKALWSAMTAQLTGADAIFLRSIPAAVGGYAGLFDELGATLTVDTLYRAEFSSWQDCDSQQRSKSRRKHDRQQGDRLNALGAVSFEEIGNGGESRCAIEVMFRQRSARFKAMGIRDTFVRDKLVSFYHEAIREGSGVYVLLHVLRLDGAIVAVRYNIVQGDRMFCLISSMSDDVAIQHGSPGKQCLLRVMQSVFDQGIAVFDMGAGFTDEKRHWCNVQVPVQHHYIGLNGRGVVIVAVHRALQKTRARIKANKTLKAWVRGVGQLGGRLTGGAKAEKP
ncbi:Acetyltransferase involved in cellulose biosynthesis, CelD/BcsL family [Devosia limi DSM 17137]|uniref:Acetyltransferase involved in cellulose biosynthesis, CelD/BcsL family n=2 Tax=Devosia limi DSM 17137 TaxID=1121477 RepID=A0A1M4UYC3_9HYPH|nr:Acetyltransferase involved in cellulose biosynthesis, CelD/BcsL family [Devosia limi DSM 17137]